MSWRRTVKTGSGCACPWFVSPSLRHTNRSGRLLSTSAEEPRATASRRVAAAGWREAACNDPSPAGGGLCSLSADRQPARRCPRQGVFDACSAVGSRGSEIADHVEDDSQPSFPRRRCKTPSIIFRSNFRLARGIRSLTFHPDLLPPHASDSAGQGGSLSHPPLS